MQAILDDLFKHYKICTNSKSSEQIINQQQGHNPIEQEQMQPSPIHQHNQVENTLISESFNLKMEIESILQNGQLSEGTKKQYRGPLIKFYSWLIQNGKMDVTSSSLEEYLKTKKISLQEMKALTHLKNTKNLVFTYYHSKLFKVTKEKARRNMIQSPNRGWSIQILQLMIF